jgi:hypothetical protein
MVDQADMTTMPPPAIIQREEHKRMEACIADMRHRGIRNDVVLGNINNEDGHPVLWVGITCGYERGETVASVYEETVLYAQAADYSAPRKHSFFGRIGTQVLSFFNLWDGYR